MYFHRFNTMLDRTFIVRYFLILIISLGVGEYIFGQSSYTLLEDDEYKFSVLTNAVMTLKFDTLKLEKQVRYIVYSGSYVTEKDTMYYRIDVWENPMEVGHGDIDMMMLDSTLVQLGQRLGGHLIYAESTLRHQWPARLARFDLDHIGRQAKVLLVKKQQRYYLLTVVMSPTSQHHKDVNRFLHSFKIYD
jgi:hypothetical protein